MELTWSPGFPASPGAPVGPGKPCPILIISHCMISVSSYCITAMLKMNCSTIQASGMWFPDCSSVGWENKVTWNPGGPDCPCSPLSPAGPCDQTDDQRLTKVSDNAHTLYDIALKYSQQGQEVRQNQSRHLFQADPVQYLYIIKKLWHKMIHLFVRFQRM